MSLVTKKQQLAILENDEDINKLLEKYKNIDHEQLKKSVY